MPWLESGGGFVLEVVMLLQAQSSSRRTLYSFCGRFDRLSSSPMSDGSALSEILSVQRSTSSVNLQGQTHGKGMPTTANVSWLPRLRLSLPPPTSRGASQTPAQCRPHPPSPGTPPSRTSRRGPARRSQSSRPMGQLRYLSMGIPARRSQLSPPMASPRSCFLRGKPNNPLLSLRCSSTSHSPP